MLMKINSGLRATSLFHRVTKLTKFCNYKLDAKGSVMFCCLLHHYFVSTIVFYTPLLVLQPIFNT